MVRIHKFISNSPPFGLRRTKLECSNFSTLLSIVEWIGMNDTTAKVSVSGLEVG